MKVIMASRAAYPFHPYGGLEKRVYHLSKRLKKQGIDVKIVASHPKNAKAKGVYDEVWDGITYTFVPPELDWTRPFALLPSIRHFAFSINLARYLANQDFDVLHAHTMAPYIYLHRRKRVPVIFQPFERAYDFRAQLRNPGDRGWLLRRGLVHKIGRHLDEYCMTHADLVGSEGEHQNDLLAELIGDKARVFELPIGVDIDSVEKFLQAGRVSRQDLGLGDDDFVLISANRLEEIKGINYLVEAFLLVKQKVAAAKLILIGTGSLEQAILSQIAEYGLSDSVVHMKNVPEDMLYRYYAISDLYVSPSLESGSVQSIVEGMACGLPAVSTGQRFCVHPGVNGYVVPRWDAKAMAEAILEIYQNDKLKEFSDNSLRIVKNFDYRVLAKTVIIKYQELLEKERKHCK